VTWSITIGDLHGDNHVMVSADIPGVWCWCGRPARAMIGLQVAFCDRCAKREIVSSGKERGYVAEKN
jgi:hypothetical protein